MKEVNTDLVRLGNVSKVAQKYKLPYDSVYRHYREHLTAAALSAGSRSLKLHGENLLQDMTDIMDTSKEILESAQADGHRGLSLKAVKEIRNNVETLGKLLYSIKQQEAQGLAPDEVEEFHNWKQDRDNINLDMFSQEDKELIREIAIQKLARMNSVVEVEDFRTRSYIVQHHVPVQDVEEILSEFDPDPAPTPTQEGDRSMLTVSMEPEEDSEANDPDLGKIRRTRFK